MFKLFRVHDKILRKLVFHHIVADIVRVNEKRLDAGLNRYLQNFMYQMLNDTNHVAAKKSLDVMIQLYHKKIWNDDRTVNVIATACLFEDSNILTAALKFFLGSNSGIEDEDEVHKKTMTAKKILAKDVVVKHQNSHSTKTSKKERKYQKALKKFHKNDKELVEFEEQESKNAIELMNDAQTFAEKLFGKLKNTNERFEVRIMMMDVISRCIAHHQLCLLNFYPYFTKYLEPYQQNITKILAIAAQSAHDQVPPESLEPLVMTIANHFVTDRSSPEAISSGLNTIREICARQPLVMSQTLLSDLTKYIKSKNRYILHSARGLITLFRKVNPLMLRKRDRGRDADLTVTGPQFGRGDVDEGIDGLELLQAYKEGKLKINLDEEEEDPLWSSDEEEMTEQELQESLDALSNNVDIPVEGESGEEDNSDDEDVEDENETTGEIENDEDVDAIDEEEEMEGEDDDGEAIEEDDDEDVTDDVEEDDSNEEDGEEFEITEDMIRDSMAPTKKRRVGFQMGPERNPDDIEQEKNQEIKNRSDEAFKTEIMTQEDFDLLAKLKRHRELKTAGKKKLKPSEIVEVDAIEANIKKTIKDMKKDGEFTKPSSAKWSRKTHKTERTSKTNRQKLKNKPFMLAKHSQGVRKKNRMGQQERAMKTYKAKKKNLKFSLKHF